MSSIVKEKYKRTFALEKKAIDEEKRTVELAFSSEEPYERSFGIEILDHDPQSLRLDRLNNGGAVLVNHNEADQVGVVESARVDGDRVSRAIVRFSKSQRGEEIFQDVVDGIRQLVSVAYRINKYDVQERKGQPDEYRVTDWEPYEVSIVSIPADTSVGVGRSETKQETIMTTETIEETKKPEFDAAKEAARVRTQELKRIDAIKSVAAEYELDELCRQGIEEGWEIADFNKKALEEVGKRNNKAREETKHDGDVDLSRSEQREFSLTRLMYAIANPNDRRAQESASFEFEVGTEATKGFGSDFKQRGAFVPTTILKRDLSVGTATAGGNLVATNLLAGSYIEVLRNASALMNAGATMIPDLVGNVAIPRQTSGAVSAWAPAEDADASESEPTFDQVPLSPKDLMCYTEVTRRLFQQSTPAIEGIVQRDLAIAQALGIDYAGLYGTGAAGQPTGIANTTGINTFNFAAADPTYAEIVRMVKEVAKDNALLGSLRFLIEAEGWEALSTTPKQGAGVEGNFILGDSDTIKGYPYTMSNQLTAEDYFFGNFSDLLIGEWGGLEVMVDPYTHSLKGKVRYVTYKTIDLAVRHPESFVFCNDGL